MFFLTNPQKIKSVDYNPITRSYKMVICKDNLKKMDFMKFYHTVCLKLLQIYRIILKIFDLKISKYNF